EWGGAALLSVEHAPISKRGIFGAYPQIGVPVGMILATGVIWLLTSVLSPEQFASFGWRIPFLFSVVLVLVGYYISRQVAESPVLGTAGHTVSEEHEGSRPLRAPLHRQQRRRLYDHRLLRRLCLPPDRRRRLGRSRPGPRAAGHDAGELRLARVHDVGRGAV